VTTRLTPLALSITTVGAWGLVLAVFSGRPELAIVVVPLLFALLVTARAPAAPDWSIAHAISAARVFEGDRVVVTVTVVAGEPVALLELYHLAAARGMRCNRAAGILLALAVLYSFSHPQQIPMSLPLVAGLVTVPVLSLSLLHAATPGIVRHDRSAGASQRACWV